jgi:hypothetical protein
MHGRTISIHNGLGQCRARAFYRETLAELLGYRLRKPELATIKPRD